MIILLRIIIISNLKPCNGAHKWQLLDGNNYLTM